MIIDKQATSWYLGTDCVMSRFASFIDQPVHFGTPASEGARALKFLRSLGGVTAAIFFAALLSTSVLAGSSVPVQPLAQGHSGIDVHRDASTGVSGVRQELNEGRTLEEVMPPSDSGPAGYQRVFPPDTRQRNSPTTHYPASTIALIEGGFSGAYGHCTGTFIGPRVVLTAAHCLYNPTLGWSDSQAVAPGADGALLPFGYQFAASAWVPSGWIESLNPYWDWGILVLPDSTLGNTVGWQEIGALRTETLAAVDFFPGTVGYPADKPIGTMWISDEPHFINVDEAFLYHRIDSYFGQSGSSVWRGSDGLIVGVVSLETELFNVARRITVEVISTFEEACAQDACWFSYMIEDPPPAPTPDPPPPPEQEREDPPDSSGPEFAFGDAATAAEQSFHATRSRTDHPVSTGQVNRTWMWGPQPNSAPIFEPYLEAPDGKRVVRYFDKSRMEDNAFRASAPWNVTNGLLVIELVTGRLQLGDNSFDLREPAQVQVAGDDHPDSPTYAMLDPLRRWDAIPEGTTLIQRLDQNGSVSDDGFLAEHGVTAAYHVADTNHTVASVFWDFMNSQGTIYADGEYRTDRMFENPFFATGFPITEAYWVNVPVAGIHQDVLLQCFQRRCLTYTPGNSSGWQVEAGNVGQHYYRWRYGDAPAFP